MMIWGRKSETTSENASILHFPHNLIVINTWARFTKHGKLALECNSNKTTNRRENSVCDLLTILTLKNKASAIY